MTDYAKIRELAEAAHVDQDEPWYGVDWLNRAGIYSPDAEHVAAANPQTVIALLDRLEELEGREPEWEYECCPHPAYDWRPCGMPEGCARERRRRRSAGPWEPVTGDDDA